MLMETATVLAQHTLSGGYRVLTLKSPRIAPQVKAGQFVHLRIPRHGDLVLRRPFSVFKTENDTLAILYKTVGLGTLAMESLRTGDAVSLLGPLGNGFPDINSAQFPALIAGGYGMAALYLVARKSSVKGMLFVGGAGAADILCVKDFEQLGWTVRIATEDGSAGAKGLVTRILDDWLTRERGACKPVFFACGPLGMLQAVSDRAQPGGWTAWLSMDRHMGCGMGACLACVQKVRASGTWKWARVCTEGPVFECRDIIWDNHEK